MPAYPWARCWAVLQDREYAWRVCRDATRLCACDRERDALRGPIDLGHARTRGLGQVQRFVAMAFRFFEPTVEEREAGAQHGESPATLRIVECRVELDHG